MASALVATVHGSYDFSDQLPEGGRFVMVFPTQQEAIEAAVAMLVDVGQVSRYHHGGWLYEGQHYTSPDELLIDWQDSLGASEYFHVLPVRRDGRQAEPHLRTVPSGALLSCDGSHAEGTAGLLHQPHGQRLGRIEERRAIRGSLSCTARRDPAEFV